MNITGYLFTINQNNSLKLCYDDLKDIEQEINIYLLNKSYNDLLTKKTIQSHYRRAVNKKIKDIQFKSELPQEIEPAATDPDINEIRKNKVNSLGLNEIQKKIILLMIDGLTYPEIRKQLKLNADKLKGHIKRIKQVKTLQKRAFVSIP